MRIITDEAEINHCILMMDMAAEEALKSTCKKSKRGAVICKKGIAVGKGFNEPQDEKYCNPCIREGIHDNSQIELCSAVHAEWMAILDADSKKDLIGATMYHIKVKNGAIIPSSGELSCTACSRIILKAGIKEFVIFAKEGYIAYTAKEMNQLSFEYFIKKIKAASN